MTDEIANDNKIKHLEFVQLTITRMGVNSFLLKGWTVTLVAALFAFSTKDAEKYNLAIISELAAFIFWLLDGYFLRQERLFRNLYDFVRLKRPEEIDFSMSTKDQHTDYTRYVNCITSISLAGFYLSLLALTAIAIITLKNI